MVRGPTVLLDVLGHCSLASTHGNESHDDNQDKDGNEYRTGYRECADNLWHPNYLE
jgi:hypothetical protein